MSTVGAPYSPQLCAAIRQLHSSIERLAEETRNAFGPRNDLQITNSVTYRRSKYQDFA